MDKVQEIKHDDIGLLQKMTTERGKILPSRLTGTCARHQRQLATAIKRARQVALMPFVSE
jgi:small subunit ribosomal protein S18